MFIPLFYDSFLYYIEAGNYENALTIIKAYIPNNESANHLQEIMKLETSEIRILISNEKKMKCSKLFNYFLIMFFALSNTYLSQGIRYILPKTLTSFYHLQNHDTSETINYQSNENLSTVTFELKITAICSGLVAFINGVLIDFSPWGRLGIIRLGIFISTIVSFLAFFSENSIDVFACILKTTLNLQDQTMDIYSSEYFEVNNRIMLLSIYNILQSLSNFMSPYINDLITIKNFRTNYLVFSITLVICFILSLALINRKKYNQGMI
jgi:hypothetical protein